MTTIYKTESGANQIQAAYREMLNAWPVSKEHLRVPTREGETFVVASGSEDAPPLFLLHGSGTNAAMWGGDVASWSEHFRVYAVDMIGEPGLSAPSRPALGSEAYALWLDDVLRELGVTRASFVGASLGGWLALDYATRRPDRVERLGLLCPGGIGRQKMGWLLKAILYRPFGKWGQRKTVELVAGLSGPDLVRARDYLALTFTHFLPRKDRLPVFSDEELRGLTMPVLVIVGGRDVMLDSRHTVARVEQAIPHAEVHLLPEVAHSIVGQTEAVLAFLRA
jgi:pimeloyl-ACP methyl ester carboxylesterase